MRQFCRRRKVPRNVKSQKYPHPIVSSPTRTPKQKTTAHIQRTQDRPIQVAPSVSVNPQETCLLDSVGFVFSWYPQTLTPVIFSSLFSKVLKLCSMFACWYLYLYVLEKASQMVPGLAQIYEQSNHSLTFLTVILGSTQY